MARAAVPTSTNMTPYSGSSSINSAPSGAPKMLSSPFRVWFMPATRVNCSLGTISEVEACIAVQ